MPDVGDMFTSTEADNCEENSDPDSNETSGDESIEGSSIRMPEVAVPEKIIICVDICLEKNVAGCGLKNTQEPNVLELTILKEALKIFLVNKTSLHKDTQFALVLVKTNEVQWIIDFTNNPEEIVNSVNAIDSSPINKAEEIQNYDITPVFQKIYEHIVLPEEDCPNIVPPSEVYRTIIIYNSSKLIPKVDLNNHCYKTLVESPYFLLDILYLHDKQSKDNNCQIIFNNLSGICKNTSYILEVSRSMTKLFNNFAKLLAHPFQRAHLGELIGVI